MVIETHGSNEAHDEEKLSNFLSKLMESGTVIDGTVASDFAQMGVQQNWLKKAPIKCNVFSKVDIWILQSIWGLRERIAEALMHDGYVYKYDLSVPLTTFDEFVTDVRNRLGNHVSRVCGYGHLGEHSSIHKNVFEKQKVLFWKKY